VALVGHFRRWLRRLRVRAWIERTTGALLVACERVSRHAPAGST
jgi:hypothetical protein